MKPIPNPKNKKRMVYRGSDGRFKRQIKSSWLCWKCKKPFDGKFKLSRVIIDEGEKFLCCDKCAGSFWALIEINYETISK